MFSKYPTKKVAKILSSAMGEAVVCETIRELDKRECWDNCIEIIKSNWANSVVFARDEEYGDMVQITLSHIHYI